MNKLMITALACMTFAGCTCTAVREGNFGIKQNMFSRSYDHSPYSPGFYMVWFGDEEFKKCWALDNLQPLEASQNMSKGNRYKV